MPFAETELPHLHQECERKKKTGILHTRARNTHTHTHTHILTEITMRVSGRIALGSNKATKDNRQQCMVLAAKPHSLSTSDPAGR